MIVENSEWKEKKAFAEELKRQWKLLWRERIDDRVRAEGIAGEDFSLLFVQRGTVIVATRDYKPLDFKQVLQQHELAHLEGAVFSSPAVGGWGKFARETFGSDRKAKRERFSGVPKCVSGQPKKCGRGWLHARL